MTAEQKKPQQKRPGIVPVNMIFRHFQQRTKVQIWLSEEIHRRFEGYIIGFDEYLNLVLDEAVQLNLNKNTQEIRGQMVLRGANIACIRAL